MPTNSLTAVALTSPTAVPAALCGVLPMQVCIFGLVTWSVEPSKSYPITIQEPYSQGARVVKEMQRAGCQVREVAAAHLPLRTSSEQGRIGSRGKKSQEHLYLTTNARSVVCTDRSSFCSHTWAIRLTWQRLG
jgi:hypothetical protein